MLRVRVLEAEPALAELSLDVVDLHAEQVHRAHRVDEALDAVDLEHHVAGSHVLLDARLYWNPEHPPPTTATRRPEPCRPSRSMVSLTMAEALSVSLTGAGGSDWVCVGGFRFSVEVSMTAVYIRMRVKN